MGSAIGCGASAPLSTKNVVKNGAANLSNRHLTSIPPNIERVIGTEPVYYLDLSKNKLTKLTDELSFLRGSLTSLNLSVNNFGSFHNFLSQLFQFPGLSRLLVSNNGMTEMPTHIGKFLYLQVLDASLNQFVSIPPDLNLLTELTHLNLSQNRITTIPAFRDLRHLIQLDLSHNSLKYLPEGFLQGVETTRVVDLSCNSLISVEAMSFPSSLVRLDVSYNDLVELPAKLFDVPDLESLNARNNAIFSMQGHRVKRLRRLTVLDLTHNPVVIPIKESAADLARIVKYLDQEEKAARKLKAAKRKLVRRNSVPWMLDRCERAVAHAPTIVDGKIVIKHLSPRKRNSTVARRGSSSLSGGASPPSLPQSHRGSQSPSFGMSFSSLPKVEEQGPPEDAARHKDNRVAMLGSLSQHRGSASSAAPVSPSNITATVPHSSCSALSSSPSMRSSPSSSSSSLAAQAQQEPSPPDPSAQPSGAAVPPLQPPSVSTATPPLSPLPPVPVLSSPSDSSTPSTASSSPRTPALTRPPSMSTVEAGAPDTRPRDESDDASAAMGDGGRQAHVNKPKAKHISDLFKLAKPTSKSSPRESIDPLSARPANRRVQSTALSDMQYVKRRVAALLSKDPKLRLQAAKVTEQLSKTRQPERVRRKSI